MLNQHRYCVIMCGGVGSRFWPYSRECRPKQFIDFFGTGVSLLQMSYDRILPVVPKENIVVVTSEKYAALVKEQLPELDDSQILLEPARRNTAPCIAWASYHIYARDPKASIIVTASDHLITCNNVFVESIKKGFDFIEHNDALLTLGIKPTRPETGYGYIQIGKLADEASGILKVKTFTEKPDIKLAKVFIESGEFFWNSGIFLWTAESILKALHSYTPDMAMLFDKLPTADFTCPEKENAFIAENFAACSSISIDNAVMELADNVYVECVNFGWSDLGTWTSLYENSPKNEDKNVTQNSRVLAYNSTGNIFAVNPEKLVVVTGLTDYVVADSDDVLLVCPRSEEQQIRHYVNDVKMGFGEKYI
ncbi:MAG: mannose-1-phosphate guanylyltransferase [Muribaculum sp.]|nr:mannose-1-phosphate guanylyltransferase [Muribaculaceae bacterium]MCM1080888.1 mannose-1-phosphate guanylyltransferase [Muribaculum sp.]